MNTTMRQGGLLLAVVGLASACGEKKTDLGQGIPGGGSDAAGFPDGGNSDALVPPGGLGVVEIEVLAPARDAVLAVAMGPEARARIRSLTRAGAPSSDPILPDSVRFIVATDDPRSPMVTGSLSGPSFTAEYAGRMDLTPLPTGVYTLAITAATRGGAQGLGRTQVTVDAGPRITILSPRHQGAYKGSSTVEIAVEAFPFELAEMPQAFVGSRAVPLQPGDGPGRYRGTLEFAKFDPPLVDEQLLRVVARNRQGTTAEGRAIFFIDEDGPLITETLPGDGDVIGGVVRVAAKLTDRAGVLGPSVVAFMGNRGGEGFELELLPEAGQPGVFSALFDTRKLSNCKAPRSAELCVLWPTLSFRASDLLGNESVVAYDVGIDNQPPVIDLDPPLMRIHSHPLGCSWQFDPVGRCQFLGDMPNDGSVVGQVFDLRARIEDAGNPADGVKIPPTAAVEPSSVTAYFMDDTSQPLAVDLDGDGRCDGINPKLIPTTAPPKDSKEILAVRLKSLKPTGSGDFTPDPSLIGTTCPVGIDIAKPAPLCVRQDMTVVIGYHAARGPEPAIWTVEPIDGPYCVGSQFDTHANQLYQEGWACIAVVATDRAGNSSVSHPLRVFIRHNLSDQSCQQAPGPPPDCTGRYDRSTTMLVAGGTCTGKRFPAGEVRPE